MVTHSSQLFDGVLKHKALHNERSGRNIAPKQFKFSVELLGSCSYQSTGGDAAGLSLEVRFINDGAVRKANELLAIQKVYHDVLVGKCRAYSRSSF